MVLQGSEDICLFAGNSHPELAHEMASYMGIKVGDAFVGHFNNGETQVMIDQSVRGKSVFIVQPTCGPNINDHVM